MTPARDEARAPLVVLVLACAVHAALLLYYFPFRILGQKLPVYEYDYALHAYQVDRALRAFVEHGSLWSYDPLVLAGQPAGVVEDLTSKSLEAFVIAAHATGISPWVAFDAYVLFVHLALLPAAWATARLFGFDRSSSAFTVLAWVLAWHFDSFLHWCWYIGMISWAFASYLILLAVALAYRALADHRARHYAGLATVSALVTFVHPFSVLTLAAPLAVTAARERARIAAWEWAALAATVVVAALTTLTWIGPVLRFRHYVGPVNAFLWPGASYALTDWLGLLRDLAMTGEPVRTALRSAFFLLSAFAAVDLVRARDERGVVLGTTVGVSIALAYLSGYSSWLRQTQPYRHVAPATLGAALLAASFVVRLARASERPGRDARAALLVAALARAPELVRTALGYLPGLLPAPQRPRSAFRPGPFAGGSSDERAPPFMGQSAPSPDYARVARAVKPLIGDSGRVAVLDWVLGEYLPTFAELPTLGGIAERNVPHAAAHPLRHAEPRRPGSDPVARYLAEYAVAAVVTKGDAPAFDSRDDLLEGPLTIGPFNVYRVRRPTSLFATGSGHISVQTSNSIRVTDASGARIVLRFHFMETLRCRPNCSALRAAADQDPVGFIQIDSPPTTFEIYNAYE